MSTALYCAIEAGGTKFLCEVADAHGKTLAGVRIPTTVPAETLGAMLEFFSAQERELGPFDGFGIAAFGPLDLHRTSPTYGHVLQTPKPQWSNVDLVSPLATRFGCQVSIDTDVNAAALAEALQGAGQGCNSVLYVTVGTGIGGGAYINGQTLKGALHPEMGHIRVLRHQNDVAFAGCCPFHGDCLEGLASGVAITARYGKALDQLVDDHEAVQVIGYYLGQLASTCILLFSPQRIIFGGGVMGMTPLYAEIRSTAGRLLNGYAGIGTSDRVLERIIVMPALGERSGIAGALALARRAAAIC